MAKALYYSDVYLVPNYSDLASRAEADVTVDIYGKKFKSAAVPANMASVIDAKLAKWMSENDYFYIMHRFGDTLKFVEDANKENWKNISISIGVKQEDCNLIHNIISKQYRVDFITIDIAHGHSENMNKMLSWLKSKFHYEYYRYNKPILIAGNITTKDAFEDLVACGADIVKVGIAGGAACQTKNVTGFHVPSYTQALWMGELFTNKNVPIILDGGVKEDADFAKALNAAGKNGRTILVMAGSVFSACIDSPAVSKDGSSKIYYGSASATNKIQTGQEVKHVEGATLNIPCNGLTVEQKFAQINQNLQSAISYAGGKNLKDISNAQFITVK